MYFANSNLTWKSALIPVAAIILIMSALAQTAPPSNKEAVLTLHATGPFDVKTSPQDDESSDPLLGRFLLDKQYHGDLEGVGTGQMLTAGTGVKGSGAYVAIEKVTGTLKGRRGSFVLQHSGIMTQSVPQLAVAIVPDSGTEDLKGISGKMTIIIAPGGKHSYNLEYNLPPQ